jgi:hypothetical protein
LSKKATAIKVAGLLLLIVWSSPQLVRAQGVCVSEERKMPVVRGIVTLPNDVPVPGATLELHEKEYGGKIVAQTQADDRGRFEFTKINSGKYVLVAKAEMLFALSVPIKLTSRPLPKNRRVELLIKLNGLPEEPCGGGRIELQECEVK